MPKYEIMTTVTNVYTTIVEADSEDDAYDIADKDQGFCKDWAWRDGTYECDVVGKEE